MTSARLELTFGEVIFKVEEDAMRGWNEYIPRGYLWILQQP